MEGWRLFVLGTPSQRELALLTSVACVATFFPLTLAPPALAVSDFSEEPCCLRTFAQFFLPETPFFFFFFLGFVFVL